MQSSRGKNQKDDNFGFVRVATATPIIKVGNPNFNAAEIVNQLKRAQAEDVAVVFFPELSITGYTCGDLFHNFELIEGALAGLELVKAATVADFTGIAFVGLPLLIDNLLYNCAVAVSRGKVLAAIPKSYLPNAGEFYEWRWFSPGECAISDTVKIAGEIVPFGTEILFAADNVNGLVIGLDVCEDGWAVNPPSLTHAIMGATMIGNLSASPEWVSKQDYRRTLFTMRSATMMAAYIYTSSGVHESTSDLVFSGHQLICENGSLIAQCKPFGRESMLTIADIDLERLIADRMRIKNFADARRRFKELPKYRTIDFSLSKAKTPATLMRRVDARPFVPRDSAQLDERCTDIFSIQVAGLAKRLEQLGKTPTIVIGVSGGLDSTLALLVACRTMDMLGLSRENIRGFTMPGFGTTQRTKSNALSLMRELQIKIEPVVDIRSACLEEMRQMNHKPFGKIDITAIYDEVGKRLSKTGSFSIDGLQNSAEELFDDALMELPAGSEDLIFENTQARMRTKILMDSGFVLGTGDLSELALGWCTYNGDHMSMYNVNAGVPKTLVRFLTKWAAENLFDGEARRVLIDICDTEISPELLPAGKDGKIAQKTENLIGPYELHDFFLYNLLRFGFRPEKILFLAKHADFDVQYGEKETAEWLKVFIRRFFRNQFKRNCLPDGPKVGSICLSPRGDWRMPSDADESLWLSWAETNSPSSANGGNQNDAAAKGWSQGPSENTAVPSLRANSPASNQTTVKANNKASGSNLSLEPDSKVLRVLLRIDEQIDFMPGGTLAVTDGDKIVPISNELARSGYYHLVIDSMDDHPLDHGSFASQHADKEALKDKVSLFGVEQQLWPDHCIHGTKGGEFHPDLDRTMVARTFKKGKDKRVDSYSAFYDNGRGADAKTRKQNDFLGQSTGLADYLRQCAQNAGADEIQIDMVGLAVPFCVSYSAKDARDEEFKGRPFIVRVIEDGVKGIEQNDGDFERDLEELRTHGIRIIQSKDVLSQISLSSKR
jgi:NAD+ synthase (glutamine-hydrolysing)